MADTIVAWRPVVSRVPLAVEWWRVGYLPPQYNRLVERMYTRPPSGVIDARKISSAGASIRFLATISGFGPGRTTNVSPASLMKKARPFQATGEAEKLVPSRSNHNCLPDFVS